MGLLGDTFAGRFEDHEVVVRRTNIDKRVAILVDGVEIAHESVALPHEWALRAEVPPAGCGRTHALIARSSIRRLLGVIPIDASYAVEMDGTEVPLRRTA